MSRGSLTFDNDELNEIDRFKKIPECQRMFVKKWYRYLQFDGIHPIQGRWIDGDVIVGQMNVICGCQVTQCVPAKQH